MKWKKASEHKPHHYWEGFVRREKSKGGFWAQWDASWGKFRNSNINMSGISPANHEWLDESEQDEGWVPVTDPEVLWNLEDTNLFLVPVTYAAFDTTRQYWDIIAGHVDENGDLISQVEDAECGWRYTDVMYYKLIGTLPPLPPATT